MKARISRYILFIVYLILCLTVSGQNPLRQINYSTTISKIFAVPENTNMDSLTSYDLSKMMWEEKTRSVETVIDQNYKLSVTTFYHETPRWEYDYEYAVGKSVTDENGVTLYDHENTELTSMPNEEADPSFKIHESILPQYGFYPIFNLSYDDFTAIFEGSGMTISLSDEDVYSAINDSIEIYIDPDKLIYETRLFSDGQLTLSDWKKYQNINGHIIPLVYVYTTYDQLMKGIRMQVSEITRFSQYSVYDEENNPLVEFTAELESSSRKGEVEVSQYKEMNKKAADIKVYPNPAEEVINVDIPLFAGSFLDLQILTTLGELVYSRDGLASGSTTSIDVSRLSKGVYLIRCGKNGKWKSTRFIKQ